MTRACLKKICAVVYHPCEFDENKQIEIGVYMKLMG